MGIPGLFSRCIKNYHNNDDAELALLKASLPSGNDVVDNHLFLDFNGAIYQVIKPEIKTNEALIIHCVAYLETICKIVPNLKMVYIAMDGVPPRAKIEQQRNRRFHSICKLNRQKKINELYGTETDRIPINTDIDTNMFTPGTQFMCALAEAIIQHVAKSEYFANIKVMFSDTLQPGEGEHKILQFIKSNDNKAFYTNPGINTNIIIYGLDGDLIMLALSLHMKNVYLLRETSEFGQYALNFEGRKYLYLDINNLQLALINNFKEYMGDVNVDTYDRLIDDYIFMGFMWGNDFMPKIHWFSIFEGGVEKFLSAYFQIYNHTEDFLVDTDLMVINTEMLTDILYLIKSQENEAVETLIMRRKRARLPVNNDMSERARQTVIMDFFPMQHRDIEQEILPIDKEGKWRSRYYQKCFAMENSDENVKMVCNYYLKTLVWNFFYYFYECPGYSWFYPFNYSPTLNDIYESLMEIKDINKLLVFDKKDLPIDPQSLLLMVMPLNSKKYLAADIQRKLNEENCGLKLYFPKKCGLNVVFHRYYHECTFNMMRIDYDKIKKFMKNVKLTPEEQTRNKITELFVN